MKLFKVLSMCSFDSLNEQIEKKIFFLDQKPDNLIVEIVDFYDTKYIKTKILKILA